MYSVPNSPLATTVTGLLPRVAVTGARLILPVVGFVAISYGLVAGLSQGNNYGSFQQCKDDNPWATQVCAYDLPNGTPVRLPLEIGGGLAAGSVATELLFAPQGKRLWSRASQLESL